ncbi:hypothetical protein BDY21DRAFT_344753 [Lineolata rhizophorae]|uniref:Uncharacterized protein n=1 Tax=Lineolata rhizophorae TaxID=578093 RepID=A0A6A6NZ73_9PEZI|nr:hypothetical protein BDY21DRAFT_344753 [Lineolata rhizophorae]
MRGFEAGDGRSRRSSNHRWPGHPPVAAWPRHRRNIAARRPASRQLLRFQRTPPTLP